MLYEVITDAFVGPIQMTARHLDQIAEGTIPEKITAEYQGDFNRIRISLNQVTGNIGRVLNETSDLIP